MSWRAPPSRPAPPVTSSSNNPLDQLFVGPSSSSSSSSRTRNLSATGSATSSSSTSSNSAHALLTRKMMEIEGGGAGGGDESDRMSIRSSRSNSTLAVGSNARQRADSSTSSISTTKGSTAEPAGSAISLRGIEQENGFVEEPIEDDSSMKGIDKGKGKAKDPSSSSKRAKLDGSARSRTNSTISSSSSFTSQSPPSSASPSRSRSSTSLASPRQPSRPVASTSTSSTLSISPSQGFLSAKRWVGKPTSASFFTPNVPPTNNDPPSSSSATIDPSASDKPAFESTSPSSSTTPSIVEPLLPEEEDPSTPKAERTSLDLPSASDSTTNLEMTSSAGRGWLSLLSGGVYGSSTDLVGEAKEKEKEKEEGERPAEEVKEEMEIEEPVIEPEACMSEAVDAVSVEETDAKDGTLRAPPQQQSEPYDSDTLTPRSVRPSRSSWWLWGSQADGAASAAETKGEQAPPAPSSQSSIEAVEPEPATQEPTAALDQVEAPQEEEDVDMIGSSKNAPRSWIQTIWGESPEELAERRKREARALKMAIYNSGLRIEGSGERKMIEDGTPSTSVTSTASFPDSSSSSMIETLSKPLRTKPSSSWAIFSRANPSANLGVDSSAASTRSRTSSHQTESTSLPPSPQLRPQPDGPVKPLTGSIRSGSQRQPPTPLAEPDPPFENLVLPTFNDTFLRAPRSFPPKKSNLNRAVSLVSAYLFSHPPATSPPPLNVPRFPGMPVEMKEDPAEKLPKALEVMAEPSRLSNVKRVVCIGVHGWFPNSRLKSVLGEPTGTSVKFATMMHDSVQAYLESSGVSSFNIQAIALEGQGQVEDRVNKLYSQLTERDEWVQALKKADVVFVSCHSQGTVVSTQLLARMLDQDLIVGAQTHLLAMCGIAQGPFVYLYQSVALAPYFNYLESAAARELFEFQDPESVVAIKFLESLRVILNAGVKVTVVGSINDQVVPLYSALFSGVNHPGILRAVYIDSDAFRTSDFLANLVVFSARLRNAGLSDHDLVYHISEALAGALTGVGHSKIYEEEEVFNLAVRHHFETTSLTEAPTHLDTSAHAPPLSMSFQPRDRRNPYLLTWSLRGVIEDPHVRQLFGPELKALGEAYETWKPQTKVLKDCKLKLEGIRMVNRNAGKL